MQKTKIDKKWFLQQLEANHKSLRGLARHLNIDPSAASRMLDGKRSMRMQEVRPIATFLHAPISEVLKHSGADIDLDGLPTRMVLAATINKKGQVKRLTDQKPLPQSVIDRAKAAITVHGDGNMLAAQIRAADGPLALFDDAIVLFKSTNTVEMAAIGALSICQSDDGEQIIATIDRARKTGEARIILPTGEVREIMLRAANPVLAIFP